MSVVTRTYAKTYTVVVPANPHLVCDECGQRVEGFRAPGGANEPCGHDADFTNTCPSWGPVDGCQCQAELGHVPHGAPALALTVGGREQGPV